MATIFYGWWIVLGCFLIAFCLDGTLYSFTAFFEPIVDEFGWSYTKVSVAFSLRGLEMGIFSPFIGILVDRFGSRKLIFSGVFIMGSSLVLLSLSDSLVVFYGAFILLGIGASACTSTVLMTAVAQWFRKNVGKAMGIVACGFGVGGILIPIVVRLIDLYGWRTTLIILALGMWILGFPLSLLIRQRPEHYGYVPDGEVSIESIPNRGRDEGKDVDFQEALRDRNFWKIGFAEAIRMMITASVIVHVMPYLSSIGMSRSRAAFLATSIPLLSIVGRFGLGWLSDIFEKRYVLAMAYCLLGAGILAFSALHRGWLIVPFLFLFPPAFGGCVSLRGAIVREYFGRTSFGKLLGIILGMGALGGVIGPTAAGWTYDNVGSYLPVWLFFAGTAAIPVVSILRLKATIRISGE